MAKKVINGQAVIYTDNGVEIVPAEVRRQYNVNGDGLQFKNLQIPKGTRYIIIGGGKTFQDQPNNINAADVMTWNIERARKYGSTKFFRFILDLMKMAQFDPLAHINGVERCLNFQWFSELKNPHESIDAPINLDADIAEIDAQLYKYYGFGKAQIDFIERRYAYDNGAESNDGCEGGQVR